MTELSTDVRRSPRVAVTPGTRELGENAVFDDRARPLVVGGHKVRVGAQQHSGRVIEILGDAATDTPPDSCVDAWVVRVSWRRASGNVARARVRR